MAKQSQEYTEPMAVQEESQAGGIRLAVVCWSRRPLNRKGEFSKTPGVLPGGALSLFLPSSFQTKRLK